MVATDGPLISASRTPTRSPCRAHAVARLTVTQLLPTPPLPLTTATTWRTLLRRSCRRAACSCTCASTFEPPSPTMSAYVFIGQYSISRILNRRPSGLPYRLRILHIGADGFLHELACLGD